MISTVTVLIIGVAATGLSYLVGNAARAAHGNTAEIGLRGLQALAIALAILLVIFIGLSMFRELLQHDQPPAIQGLGLFLVMGMGLVVGAPPIVAGRPSREG